MSLEHEIGLPTDKEACLEGKTVQGKQIIFRR
jgi:hypothetical protein